MKITLVRSGGIIPIRKVSQTEVNWMEEDIIQLKKSAEILNASPGLVRDGVFYHLKTDIENFPIDWTKIPSKYKSTLEKLKEKLAIE